MGLTCIYICRYSRGMDTATQAPITTADYTERIECSCATCEVNAAKIGRPFPLAAFVRPATLDATGRGRKAIHGLVYTIHDPFTRAAEAQMSKRGIPPLGLADHA